MAEDERRRAGWREPLLALPPPQSCSMARILVADDDMQVRMIVRLMLEGAGHTVAEAPDGRVALKMWRAAHEPFDLMITDIMMPETDGFEAIIEFRKTWPSAKIIAITGGGQSRTDTFLRTAEKLGVCQLSRSRSISSCFSQPSAKYSRVPRPLLLQAHPPGMRASTSDSPSGHGRKPE